MSNKPPRIRRPYTPSPEARERRRERDRIKGRKRRAAARATKVLAAKSAPTPMILSRNKKWRIGPPAKEMSKADLRAQFVEAIQNTARL